MKNLEPMKLKATSHNFQKPKGGQMPVSGTKPVALRLLGVCLLGTIFLFTLFFMAQPAPAFAQGGKNPKKAIKKLDKNGDGKVSRDEWRKSPEIFNQIDTDGDGYLTLREFKARFAGGDGDRKVPSEDSTAKQKNSDVANSKKRGAWYGDERYWQGPIIDAHSQVDQNTNLSKIVPLLNQAGVARAVLSTRFGQPTADILKLAARHPDRIFPAAKTKTKAFMKGHSGFPGDFYSEIKRADFRAMAEIIMWHAAKKAVGAGQATMDPDDSRVKIMMKTARQKGWPFIAHVEFAVMGFDKGRYMKKFETFLSKNRDVPIGLIHMGQLNAKDAARLLPKHPNLFFITSHCNPVTTANSKLPWTKMFKWSKLAPAWEALILSYPDRFVLAFDNVFSFHWVGTFMPQVLVWRKALSKLPDKTAHALAHGNAERLWKLPSAILP
jgi:hypothetical protein